MRIRRDQIASEENRANLHGRVAELAQLRDQAARSPRSEAPAAPRRQDRRCPEWARDHRIAHAGKILGEPQWITSASRAGEFLWQHAFDEKNGRLRHHIFQGEAAGEGFLNDYAMLGLAYLALGEATGDQVGCRALKLSPQPS